MKIVLQKGDKLPHFGANGGKLVSCGFYYGDGSEIKFSPNKIEITEEEDEQDIKE